MLSGDVILTKKAESHFVRTPQETPCKFIAVGFSEDDIGESYRAEIQTFLDERPLGQFNLYPAAQFKDTHWKYYLQQINDHRENPALSSVYLSVLLAELMQASTSISQPSRQRSDQLFAVIAYINSHLSEPMSVESLCQQFFISRSQLNRLFRKMTGASVWDYVVAKRLMYAKLLLEAGETPAAACQKCGFNDYSPFYRAYKARYGVSPRLHKQKHG
jgi:AraC-like DNA-binding protein